MAQRELRADEEEFARQTVTEQQFGRRHCGRCSKRVRTAIRKAGGSPPHHEFESVGFRRPSERETVRR